MIFDECLVSILWMVQVSPEKYCSLVVEEGGLRVYIVVVQVSPEKYCSLVVEEGGLRVLEEMLNANSGTQCRKDVYVFAEMVR